MNEFYVAAAGACAALAGLVIVALSVSVKEVIDIPGMASRAGASIALLIGATVIALGSLVDQPAGWTGTETLIAGAACLVLAVISMVALGRSPHPGSLPSKLFRTGIAIAPALLFMAAGVLIFGENVWAGALIGLGTILAIIIAVLDTWVVLIEIRRSCTGR